MEGGGGTAPGKPEQGGGGGEEEAAARCHVSAWGAGSDGQLGIGGVDDQLLPRPVPLLCSSTFSVSHVSCGGAHAIALTDDGNVLTWGRGTCGQLGHGDLENCLEPKPVKFLKCFSICHVSAGWNHSGFVTDTGHLFTCGDNSFGQLGHDDHQSYFSPKEVAIFASMHVTQIACGLRHSLVLIKGPSGDVVFGFGSGKHGQVGTLEDGISRFFYLPKVVHHFKNDSVVSLCANGDQSAALTADGRLYTWGRGFHGKLTGGIPQIVSSLKFSQVALGWNHALVLAECGEVFMLGGYHHGMLSCLQEMRLKQQQQESSPSSSIDETSTIPILQRVPNLEGKRVAHIAAGAEHSAIVTEAGEIMTWGWGEHGQLGLGNILDQTIPQIVNVCEIGSFTQTRFRIYCGSGFTIALLVCG